MRRTLPSLVALLAACGAPVAAVVVLPAIDLDAGRAPAASDAAIAERRSGPVLECARGMKWESRADDEERLEPRPYTAEESADLAEYERVRSSDASADDRESAAFYRANTFYMAGRYAEAAFAFRELLERPGRSGPFAAELYVRCLSVLASHGAPACKEVVASEVHTLVALHCGADPWMTCTTLRPIDAELARSAAHGLPHAEAGERYLALFDQFCRAAQPSTDHCDELLYNAGVSFRAAGDATRAIAALARMKDPKNKVDKSPLTARLACILSSDAGACH